MQLSDRIDLLDRNTIGMVVFYCQEISSKKKVSFKEEYLLKEECLLKKRVYF